VLEVRTNDFFSPTNFGRFSTKNCEFFLKVNLTKILNLKKNCPNFLNHNLKKKKLGWNLGKSKVVKWSPR